MNDLINARITRKVEQKQGWIDAKKDNDISPNWSPSLYSRCETAISLLRDEITFLQELLKRS